jgi:hypothetical protein
MQRLFTRTHGICAVLALALAGCKSDCVQAPCPLTEVLRLKVTAANSAAPPAGLTLQVNDQPPRSDLCDADGICRVVGQAGDYWLTIAAPGYIPQDLVLTMTSHSRSGCGCPTITPRQLDVSLQPE